MQGPFNSNGSWRYLCMVAGALCAAAKVYADNKIDAGSGAADQGGDSFLMGAIYAVASIFCGGLNMALFQYLGSAMKMSPVDSAGYMGIPVVFFLTIPLFFLRHSIKNWQLDDGSNQDDPYTYTDIELMRVLWTEN